MDYFKSVVPTAIHGMVGLSSGNPDEPYFDVLRPEVALKVYLLLWIAQALPFPFNIVFSRVGVLLNLGTSIAIMSSLAVMEGAYSRCVLANQHIDGTEKVHIALGNLYLLGVTLPTSIGPTRFFYFHAIHNIMPNWLLGLVPNINTFL